MVFRFGGLLSRKFSSAVIPSWEKISVSQHFSIYQLLFSCEHAWGSQMHAVADSDNELFFKFAGVIYYVDPKSVGIIGFLESKERI